MNRRLIADHRMDWANVAVRQSYCPARFFRRRDGRVAEGARLESVFTRKGNVGSNPTLSASFLLMPIDLGDGLTSTDVH